MTDRSSRRLFERLAAIGAARELTGRSTSASTGFSVMGRRARPKELLALDALAPDWRRVDGPAEAVISPPKKVSREGTPRTAMRNLEPWGFRRRSRVCFFEWEAVMMDCPPRTPVDLQAVTRDTKARVRRIIGELEAIEQQTDPIFAQPRDVSSIWYSPNFYHAQDGERHRSNSIVRSCN